VAESDSELEELKAMVADIRRLPADVNRPDLRERDP
jgi:hypothetical protein